MSVVSGIAASVGLAAQERGDLDTLLIGVVLVLVRRRFGPDGPHWPALQRRLPRAACAVGLSPAGILRTAASRRASASGVGVPRGRGAAGAGAAAAGASGAGFGAGR